MGGWIKCSERMPEYFSNVLVTDGEGVEVMRLDCDGCWDTWLEPWVVTVAREDVTHWMPLPEPPSLV